MPIRKSACDWDPRWTRCEHLAADGRVDRVTYESATGDPAPDPASHVHTLSVATPTRLAGWLLIAISFASGVVVGQLVVWIA